MSPELDTAETQPEQPEGSEQPEASEQPEGSCRSATDGDAPLPAGAVVDDTYRILRLIGAGAMGRIYEAEDQDLQRRVALKIPKSAVGGDMILREARALAALRHPGLPTVFGVGRRAKPRYMVMELLAGLNLAHRLERTYDRGRPLALEEALQILTQVGSALQAIHEAGIAHRDIKPANVLLSPSRGAVLVDFGLVLPEFDIHEGTQVAGTPAYMAPETIDSTATSGEGNLVDLYSFGVLGFEVVTGALPFVAHDVASYFEMHTSAPIPDPRSYRPDLPVALADLLTELMAKQPGQRPQSAEEVVWRLRAITHRARDAQADKRRSVVVVDDDQDMRELLGLHVGSWVPGVAIRQARDGVTALDLLAAETPYLLLLDVDLPDMSGVELLMDLRGRQTPMPAATVVVSGKLQPQDIHLFRRLGVQSFVVKGPGMPEALGRIVRNVFVDRT